MGPWEGIYLGLFVFGAGFLLIQVVLGQFGHADVHASGDGDTGFDTHASAHGHAEDSGHQHSGGHDLSFMTPLIIAPTLAGIGTVGLLLALLWNVPWLLHLPLALLGGLALGYAIFFVLARIIAPMQGSSEVRVGELWGTVAEVTTPIPENRLGEIRFIASGSYHTTPARSVTGETIPRGATVMIEKVENSIAFVRTTR
ncbi:MAG: hypothetical protein ACRDIB_20035 [Ardenticatenaceae bacterium]